MATLVPISLGGTGSSTISGVLRNIGLNSPTLLSNLNNVNIITTTIEGLTLNSNANGIPTFINSNLHMAVGTRINGTPVIDDAILNNASIAAGGLTWLTENGNAFVTTARLIYGAAYPSNTALPSAITYNGYFGVDHAHSQAFFSDGYKYNRLLTANTSIVPDTTFGTYNAAPDNGIVGFQSYMDIGKPHSQIRNITMHGAIRGANVVVIDSELFVGGDNGFRFLANDTLGDRIMLGPGGIDDTALFQINGNLRINGNLVLAGATVSQDLAATRVEINLNHFASTTNTKVNSLVFGLDSSNTNIDAVNTNLNYFASTANSNIDTVQDNLSPLSSQIVNIHSGNTEFTVDKIFNSNVTIQGNLVVTGATISADVTNLTVEDPFIVLANNQPNPASYDAGLLVSRTGNSTNQAWIWDESNDGWSAIATADTGTGAGSITATGYWDIYGRDVRPQRDLISPNVYITTLTSGRVPYITTSGKIVDDGDLKFDGTTLYATNAVVATGYVTTFGGGSGTLASLDVTDATASTSKDTGALIITAGGLGVEGAIHAGGDVSAFNTSDYRLKHNVKTIDSALDKLDRINGVEFDWDASEAGLHYGHLKGHDVGVIAQDLKEVLPEAIKERDDGYLAVDYGRVVPLLIQAIKELKKQIEDK